MDLRQIVDEIKNKVSYYKGISKDAAELKKEVCSAITKSTERIEKMHAQREITYSRYIDLEARMRILESKIRLEITTTVLEEL